MPRAAIPERLRTRQLAQQVAVAQREAASAEAVLVEQIDTVSGGIPADLQATIDDLNTRVTELETATP